MKPTANTDVILIEGLEFTGRHGWFDHERRDGSHFKLDVRLSVDVRGSASTDALPDTVDYGAAAETILTVGAGPSCHLVERLAELMCAALFERHPLVRAVDLTLRKLDPPMDAKVQAVGVQMHRVRPL
jgi:dihydroneopterin aldolase